MDKSKIIIKFLRNNIQIIGLFFLILIAVLSTNLYSLHKKNQINSLEKILENIYLKKTITSIIESLEPRYEVIDLKIKSGETFERILNKIDISEFERNKILKKVSKFKFINKLYKNQKLLFKIDKKEPSKILKFSIQITKTKKIIFTRDILQDIYNHKIIETNLKKIIVYKEAEISNSLYSSATKLGIKPNIIIDFARIYGFQIDFQRDIWKNDTFQIVYETFLDESGKILDTGNIIYANLILQGRENPLYIFKQKKNFEHFDKFGKSVRKSLMKTPIYGAR